MEVAGSVCAKVELEVGGCCPGQMGEKHWGVHTVHPLEKGHCQSATRNTTRAGKRLKKRKGQGRRKGRECCNSTAGQAPGPRHSRTRFWQAEPVTLLGATATCCCNKGSQSAESTAEVCPRRRALVRARQLVVRRRLVAWFRPNPTTPSGFPCTLYDSKNNCCMQCGSGSSGARP